MTAVTDLRCGSRLSDLVRDVTGDTRLPPLTEHDLSRMRAGMDVLAKALAEKQPVYGVTRGFGPLVAYAAADDGEEQGAGLIAHLGSGQGDPLPPEVCRLAVWLRLSSMRQGYSAVSPEFLNRLIDIWNRGFTPAIPRYGTVSASGDLQPLAHAALAHTGHGEAWVAGQDGTWSLCPADLALAAAGVEALTWPSREALAFVNGTSVCLAMTIVNHVSVLRLVRVMATLTARMAGLLGANPEAYHDGHGHVRGQPGQLTVARWIRAELPGDMVRDLSRPLQEPYSLRCAPQVLGAVLDQLNGIEDILVREATGCTDNPICFEGEVLHGGNFHAMPVGLSSDQIGLCLQQVAYLADRQLALLCDPARNGGLPPMLTPRPGAGSGLAGVQLSATSFVSRIRQLVYPSSLTALPTNGGNQDHVPMALNGAGSVAEAAELAWLVAGSLALGLTQYAHLVDRPVESSGLWGELALASPPLDRDRPLAGEVRAARDLLLAHARTLD